MGVRKRIVQLVSNNVWPSKEMTWTEVPAGGGRLLQALETIDRLASRWSEPQPHSRPNSGPIIDVLLPHVNAALLNRFTVIERDTTSHALDGSNSVVFKPQQPPLLLHCEGVVMIWRFVHEALNAPLKLGVPVDLVVQPFLQFLAAVLNRTKARLVRPCERKGEF